MLQRDIIGLQFDARHVVSGSGDKTLRVFDTQTGQYVAFFSYFRNSILFLVSMLFFVHGSAVIVFIIVNASVCAAAVVVVGVCMCWLDIEKLLCACNSMTT